MNKCDKILEAQTQLNTTEHYKPLKKTQDSSSITESKRTCHTISPK